MRRAPATATAIVIALASVARAAQADEPVPDQPQPADDGARRAIDRTWLYADDARVAAPLTVVGMTNASYTNAGPSPSRIASPFANVYAPFAANTAQPGGMVTAGGEVGLLPRLSVVGLGQMGFGSEQAGTSAGATAGLRFQVLPSSWTHTRLVVSTGYLREAWSGPFYSGDTGKWYPGNPHGDNGAWVQAAFSGDVGRARFATTLHGEHIFSDGRDPLDVMVQVGASYRVVGAVRAGVEYVGQDLEEIGAAGAEGGARHFAGPTASVQLLGDRLTIVGGPSVGLSEASPRLLARVAVAYGF